MNSNFSEDDILKLLNEVKIDDTELSDKSLSELEKKALNKKIIKKVKHKNFNFKKILAVASISIILISIPVLNSDAFNKISEKTSILSGIGQLDVNDENSFSLNHAIISNGLTLQNFYVDNNKVIISIKNSDYRENESYSLKTDDGTKYNLKPLSFYSNFVQIGFSGKVKNSSFYDVGISKSNKTANFHILKKALTNVKPVTSLYKASNGIVTFNIASVKKSGNTLLMSYFVTDKFKDNSMLSLFLNGSKTANNSSIKSTVDHPLIYIEDKYGNKSYGYNDTSGVNNNESKFDLTNIKGNNIKLKLSSIPYSLRISSNDKKSFNIKLAAPQNKLTYINKAYELNGLKFKIISIDRSLNTPTLTYTVLESGKNDKRKVVFLSLYSLNYHSFKNHVIKSNYIDEGSFLICNPQKSNTLLENTVNIDNAIINYVSVGPFDIKLDLNKIK